MSNEERENKKSSGDLVRGVGDTDNTTEEQVDTEAVELDFEEAIKTKVEEAIKPLQESISELSNKYDQLLEESKKKRTILKVNSPKRETPMEKLHKEVDELYERVKNLIV